MIHESATLQGRVIAIPETRELDVFAGLLERRGAHVVRCPLVAIHDAPEPAPILAWVKRVIDGECDDLILLTGEGLRRIVSCVDRHDASLRAPFIVALSKLRKITRGPKPAKALRELSLQSDLAPDLATTEGVIDLLSAHDLRGRCVGVQLYGSDPNERLIKFLEHAGARVLTVSPYIYADKSEDDSIRSLAQRLMNDAIDAMAFTSMQQVTRWFDVLGEEDARRSLSHTRVAAVGPVVADALNRRNVTVAMMPSDAYFLKPLTRALEEQLGPV